MANPTPGANNSQPKRAPVVIRSSAALDRNSAESTRRMLLFGGCIILSLVVHVVLISMFLLVQVDTAQATTGDIETAVIETKVEDAQQKAPDLENDEIGLDPDVPTNYDVNRIEEVSVPGAVNVDQAVGIKDAPEAMASTIPPPPGFGDNRGQGGGVESAVAGSGALVGFAG